MPLEKHGQGRGAIATDEALSPERDELQDCGKRQWFVRSKRSLALLGRTKSVQSLQRRAAGTEVGWLRNVEWGAELRGLAGSTRL